MERLGSGTSARSLRGAGWTSVLLALAVAAVAGTADERDAPSRSVMDRRPDVAVTAVAPPPPIGRELPEELGRLWRDRFDTLLADVPGASTQRLPVRPALPLLTSGGRTAGYAWDDEVAVDAGGERWRLAVEVTSRPPWPHADPCRPERWGMPGAHVASCVVEPGEESSTVLATSAPVGGTAHRGAAGWTYVVDVHDANQQVQLLLTRDAAGSGAPPLSQDELVRMARHPSWYDG